MPDTLTAAQPISLPPRPHLDIRDGVDGDVAAGTITVHAGAAVRGRLDARSIIINGAVSGVIAAGSIAIGQTGRVEGELRYGVLAVEPGAEVMARCVPGLAHSDEAQDRAMEVRSRRRAG